MINNVEFNNRNELIELTKQLYLNFQSFKSIERKQMRNTFKIENEDKYNYLKREIQSIYNEGYGLKIIARNLNITYTICRSIFSYLEIPINKGYNIVTSKLCEFRKNKAIDENKNNIGFNNSRIIRKYYKDNRGMQGYIWNSTLNKYVWIRSSYEYIFAKWLNRNNIKWEYDYTTYNLPDGTKYRPDFFILNDENKIENIIEIKGYWDNRLYKVDLLRKILNDVKITVVGSDDIKSYIEDKSNFNIEKQKWNLERKINKITKNQNEL